MHSHKKEVKKRYVLQALSQQSRKIFGNFHIIHIIKKHGNEVLGSLRKLCVRPQT